MIPLRDDISARSFPAVTVTIIALNVVAFIYELLLGPQLEEAVMFWGIVPARYTTPEVASLFSWPAQLWPFFTSMFLHGGWLHLIGNMWILWIFGDNVEDRMGRGRFVFLYLLSGIVAALMHIYTNADSMLPTVGASGAIAGVMGAYFRLFPHARVSMLIPPFFFGPYFVVPAVLFLGWWFFIQFFNGTFSLLAAPNEVGGIAWWAHIGGFVFGALLCSLIKDKHFYRQHHEEQEEQFS
jgi:membrane associated rhomboid family serine protease